QRENRQMPRARQCPIPWRRHQSLQSCRSACTLRGRVAVARDPECCRSKSTRRKDQRPSIEREGAREALRLRLPLSRRTCVARCSREYCERHDDLGTDMPLTATAVTLALSAIASGAHPRADSLLGTGISRALATARAAQIRDVRYALSLDLTERDS